MNNRSLFLASLALLTVGCTPSWTGSGPEPVTAARPAAEPSNSASFRVVESATGKTVPFASVIARAAMADVVFFGEQHDDPETHFLEFALLEGLGRRHDNVVLSLEMFERDVQPELNRYLLGAVSESTFLAKSRPWPRYATDYRGMVQLARVRGWPVVAANIPRPMASAIARKGLQALDTLTTAERMFAARALMCPNDAYFTRFAEAMGGHGAGGGPPTAADNATAAAMTQRFYEAQCAKDETMAESIANRFIGTAIVRVVESRSSGRRFEQITRGNGVLLHVNGAFHSDYGQGTAERVRRRIPDIRTLVITAVPVENPGTAVIGAEAAKADYVIFTRSAKPGGSLP
jgi:uncharacterized iron-regulated protein